MDSIEISTGVSPLRFRLHSKDGWHLQINNSIIITTITIIIISIIIINIIMVKDNRQSSAPHVRWKTIDDVIPSTDLYTTEYVPLGYTTLYYSYYVLS